MPERPPAQRAYEAFLATMEAVPAWCPPFEALAPVYPRAWEAAAQAVLDAWQAQPRLETLTPEGDAAC